MAGEFDSYRIDAQQLACEDTLDVFRRNTVMRGIQTAQMQEAQELLDAIVDEWDGRLLDNAVGYQLDSIGRIVGLWPRPMIDASQIVYFGPDDVLTGPDWADAYVTGAPLFGQVAIGDPEYRTRIRARIAKNHVKYGSAPEIMYFGLMAFGVPVSVKNIGFSDLEVVLPSSVSPTIAAQIIREVSDLTADHKFDLPLPTLSRIVRVSYRYPNAFAPDVDDGAPDISIIGVSHYVVNP